MKIFLPFNSYEIHPYIEEIIQYSKHEFHFKSINDYTADFEIINIHWPEAIFDWKEPSENELDSLEKLINFIKRTAVIIYTKHDIERTKGTTPRFNKLYEIIEKNTDVFIHLGKFSKNLYEQKFPNAGHEIIHHPVYEKSFSPIDKSAARNKLGIDNEASVVVAPGNIRSNIERDLVLKSFNALKLENKVLISTNMRNDTKLDFPGRVRLKRFYDVKKVLKEKFKNKYLAPKYLFNYSPMAAEELSLRISAADVVLVPRVNILNSGLVFLGLSFGKVVVGPATGNISEQLEELNFPVFNPYSLPTVTRALEKGIKLNLKGNFVKKPLSKYLPINVAFEYDRLFFKYKKL